MLLQSAQQLYKINILTGSCDLPILCSFYVFCVQTIYMKMLRQVAELKWGKRIQMTKRTETGCHDAQEMLLMWTCVLLVMTPHMCSVGHDTTHVFCWSWHHTCVLLVMTWHVMTWHHILQGNCCYLHLHSSRSRHCALSLKFHHSSHVHTCKCKCFSLEHHLQRWKVNDQHLPYHRQRHRQQEHTVAEQADREDRFGL